MKCPKCEGEMESVVHQDIEVDRCKGCQGLWFDASEKEQLLTIQGAEAIDPGVANDPQRDLMKDVKCPRCEDVKMIHMVDGQQVHVHYESCPECGGSFLDAGEFTDLKDYSFSERLKTMLREFREEYL